MSTNEMLDRKMSAVTDALDDLAEYIVNDLDFNVDDNTIEFIKSVKSGAKGLIKAIDADRKVKAIKRICKN